MNIVIFSDSFLPKIDGIAISTEQFCRLLAEKGHRFVICCPKYGPADTDAIGENVKIIRFKNAPLPSYPDIKVVLPSRKKIIKAMNLFEPDLVHIQTPGPLGQYGVLAAKMYGVPLMGTYHTLVNEQDMYLSLYRLLKMDALLNMFRSNIKIGNNLDKIERKKKKSFKSNLIYKLTNMLYESGRLIISPSHLIKNELISQGVKTPIEVVSNGMNLTRFKSDVRTEPQSPAKILHVGRISFEKNCEVVLRAFALMIKDKPDLTLDIIGDGPALKSLKTEAKQLGIAEKVNFPGFISYDTLPEVYPRYDLFLTASTMETQGLVVLESMACGLPCIGVNSYALPELIHHEQNGYIVEPFDHIKMAEHALALLSDKETYRSFSEESLKISKEHEVQLCASRLEAIYKQVIESAKTNPPEKLPADKIKLPTELFEEKK